MRKIQTHLRMMHLNESHMCLTEAVDTGAMSNDIASACE